MKIVISPYSNRLREHENPKNYPYWKELINLINRDVCVDCVTQIGVQGETKLVQDFRTNLPIPELKKLIQECDVWIAVDNFLQHMVHAYKLGKPGIVLWGRSDPLIFGYPENQNLLKDRKLLRADQFWDWQRIPYSKDIFVSPEEVHKVIVSILNL